MSLPKAAHIALLLLSALCLQVNFVKSALKEGDCEVCVGVINKLLNSLEPEEKTHQGSIEAKFKEICPTLKKAENRFCYYVGGLEESATKIVSELAQPLSWTMPPLKVCERLMKKDSQICDLRYEKVIDLKTVDLKKLKVRDLKKILSDWDETCEGCVEKTDYVRRIEELKKVHAREEL